ncbi:MAG: hypothetical protein WCK63_14875 [Betaproteobacteria bacterium]
MVQPYQWQQSTASMAYHGRYGQRHHTTPQQRSGNTGNAMAFVYA